MKRCCFRVFDGKKQPVRVRRKREGDSDRLKKSSWSTQKCRKLFLLTLILTRFFNHMFNAMREKATGSNGIRVSKEMINNGRYFLLVLILMNLLHFLCLPKN
jgi:hypothetical protein